MKNLFLLLVFFSACTSPNTKNQISFSSSTAEDEWANYEGKWLAKDGVLKFELSLRTGSIDYDSDYKFYEGFYSDVVAQSTSHHGKYSSSSHPADSNLRITVHDLAPNKWWHYFRYKETQLPEGNDAMFFITRGNEELLLCDNNFNPITTDWRFTLHKRSKLFTVEGYITFFANDSIKFFERNVREYWHVDELGEIDKVKENYLKLAIEKNEGVYLRALAYSVESKRDDQKRKLVVKTILGLGNDPNP